MNPYTLISALAACGHLMASGLAIEPFDGTIGVPITDSGSGTGWDGTWTGGAVLTYDAGLSFIASGPDSVGLVASSGQSIKAGGSPAGQNNDPRRMLSSGVTIGDDAGAGELPEAFLSFIYQNSGSVPAGHEFRVALTNGTSVVASFGKEINSPWRLRSGSAFESAATSYAGNFFCVIKLAYDAGADQTTITGYRAGESDSNVDLTDLATYPVSVSLNTPGRITFDSVQIFTHNSTTARFDEIRLGTDLSNVSTTPDPLLVTGDPATFTTDNAPDFTDITVTNAGASNDLVITAATLGGPDAAAFSINPADLPITIAPGGANFIPVDFTPYPVYQASYTATLEIASNDASSPKIIAIQVTNQPDPRIEVAATVDFQNNGSAAGYSIPVSNTGFSEVLSITNVTTSGFDASTVSGLAFPATIQPGLSGEIEFIFTPNDGLGAYRFALEVASNDASTPARLIDVTINVAEPLISAVPAILDFGLSANNPAPSDLAVTITNTAGTLDLNIDDSTAITGSSAFSIVSPALPLAIPPGGSRDITVRFDPGSGGGRFSAMLTFDSDDVNNTVLSIPLEAFVDPAGTVVARFDFDPDQSFGAVIDVDGSSAANWTVGDLSDQATVADRSFRAGLNGGYLAFAARREADAQTPLSEGGNNLSTWSRFSIAPESGGGAIDFTGGTAVVDTYAASGLGGTTSADWTLYYSTDGGTTWTALGTAQQGAAITGSGTAGPVGLSWDLTPIGSQTDPVEFILDPSTIGYGTNGVVNQRDVGFDNLVITAGSVTPGSGGGNFSTWAAGFGIPNDPGYDGSDNDGIPALVEYALGLSPLTADGSPGTFDGSTLAFTKSAEAVANGDVNFAIETSQTLEAGSWTTVTPEINDAAAISHTLPAGQGKIFSRLVVTQK